MSDMRVLDQWKCPSCNWCRAFTRQRTSDMVNGRYESTPSDMVCCDNCKAVTCYPYNEEVVSSMPEDFKIDSSHTVLLWRDGKLWYRAYEQSANGYSWYEIKSSEQLPLMTRKKAEALAVDPYAGAYDSYKVGDATIILEVAFNVRQKVVLKTTTHTQLRRQQLLEAMSPEDRKLFE